jgi:phosphoenolpyruvate carboxylase
LVCGSLKYDADYYDEMESISKLESTPNNTPLSPYKRNLKRKLKEKHLERYVKERRMDYIQSARF